MKNPTSQKLQLVEEHENKEILTKQKKSECGFIV